VPAHVSEFLIGQPAMSHDGDGADVFVCGKQAASARDELFKVIRADARHLSRSAATDQAQNRMKSIQARGERVARATMPRARNETRCPIHLTVPSTAVIAMAPTTGSMSMSKSPCRHETVSHPRERG
jgi:hypothetical protein